MLILSRQRDECIEIRRSDADCWIVTVVEIRGDKTRLHAENSDQTKTKLHASMLRDEVMVLEPDVQIGVIDIRGDKVRIGITDSKDFSVHRLEVAKAIRRENDAAKRLLGDEDGLAGSRVPRPGGPRPPELDVRLDEPRADDPG